MFEFFLTAFCGGMVVFVFAIIIAAVYNGVRTRMTLAKQLAHLMSGYKSYFDSVIANSYSSMSDETKAVLGKMEQAEQKAFDEINETIKKLTKEEQEEIYRVANFLNPNNIDDYSINDL